MIHNNEVKIIIQIVLIHHHNDIFAITNKIQFHIKIKIIIIYFINKKIFI